MVFCYGSRADYSSYMPEHSGLLRERSSVWSRIDVSTGQPVNSGASLKAARAEPLVRAAICPPLPLCCTGTVRGLPQETCHLQVSDFSSTSETRIREICVPLVRQALFGSGCSAEPGICTEAQRGCAPQRGKAGWKRTGLYKQEKEAPRLIELTPVRAGLSPL